ncbi:MAG: hypothetical protein KBE91_05800 [Bacteroidia bacterium]|nr:hypothetical protein [Bacteroidia bacterium]MBP9689108.1 hypothetical protein [Bacteroidia bacterium]
MFKPTHRFFVLMMSIVFIVACNNNNNNGSDIKAAHQDSLAVADSIGAECNTTSTRYPNNDKPMALMMRQMADNAQKMKNKIEAGVLVDSTAFPFIRFYLVEPTDPNVLQPQFFENARMFQLSYKDLMNAPIHKQKEMYTLYINQCINCHQTYCSGPLKRIRKLVIN